MIERIIELLDRETELDNTEPDYIERKYKNPIKKLMDDYEDALNVDKLTKASSITDDVKNEVRNNMERLLVGSEKLDVG